MQDACSAPARENVENVEKTAREKKHNRQRRTPAPAGWDPGGLALGRHHGNVYVHLFSVYFQYISIIIQI